MKFHISLRGGFESEHDVDAENLESALAKARASAWSIHVQNASGDIKNAPGEILRLEVLGVSK
jgi:hypothetical protein